MMLFLCLLTCLAGGVGISLAAKNLKEKRYFLFGFDVMLVIMDVFLVAVCIIHEFIL